MGLVQVLSRNFRKTPGPTGQNDAGDPDQPLEITNTPSTIGGSAQHAADARNALQETLDKVDRMIRGGRALGFANAARHLEHWRQSTGRELTMPASAFVNQDFINTWLKENVWKEFVKGTEKRLKTGELVAGGTIEMYWIGSLYAPPMTDLFFALGGFTIRSDVVVRSEIVPNGGETIYVFDQWKCQASDRYNWDVLKSTYIPGIGRVKDEELRLLESHGIGKTFDIKSETWFVTDPRVLQSFAVTGY